MQAFRHPLLFALVDMQNRIRDAVVAACEHSSSVALAEIVKDGEGDVIFAVDRVAESVLLDALTPAASVEPLVLYCEGLDPDGVVLPGGAMRSEVKWRVIVDPIDGTRGLMYQKRPAWSLAAAAPERGIETRLRHAVFAVQTEIPLVKQHLSDQFIWSEAHGLESWRHDRTCGMREPLHARPSRSPTLHQGFAAIARFFPGARAECAAIDDALIERLLGPATSSKPRCFEDQYLSTAGQLHELFAGRDRFVADLRPRLSRHEVAAGRPPLMCAHPYDICTFPIAESLGVQIRNLDGSSFDAPMDLEADVEWAGYANATLCTQIAPLLKTVLAERGIG